MSKIFELKESSTDNNVQKNMHDLFCTTIPGMSTQERYLFDCVYNFLKKLRDVRIFVNKEEDGSYRLWYIPRTNIAAIDFYIYYRDKTDIKITMTKNSWSEDDVATFNNEDAAIHFINYFIDFYNSKQ